MLHTMYTLYTLYTLFTLYTSYTLYTLYTLYTMCIQGIYNINNVYNVYTVNNVYNVYIVYLLRKLTKGRQKGPIIFSLGETVKQTVSGRRVYLSWIRGRESRRGPKLLTIFNHYCSLHSTVLRVDRRTCCGMNRCVSHGGMPRASSTQVEISWA